MTHLDGQVATIAARQHGAFHRRQLEPSVATHSAVRRRVDTGRWERGPGHVYVVSGSADTWHRRLWIGLLEAGPDTVLSRRSAAVLTGLPGFKPGPVDVLKREAHEERMRSCELHVSSWLPPSHRTHIDGFPTTSVARTLFDLAALGTPARRRRGLPYLHPDRAERAVDDALVRDLTTLDQLAEVVATLGKQGRPGTRRMRAILEERGAGHIVTESVLEDLFMAVITSAGLPHPARQRTLGGDDLVGRVDFLYKAERVVIECDGRRHHFGKVDAERDRWRDLELSAAGWLVIRVTWWQLVHQPERFTAHLQRVLDRRRGPAPAK
jgi:hypothetical protein